MADTVEEYLRKFALRLRTIKGELDDTVRHTIKLHNNVHITSAEVDLEEAATHLDALARQIRDGSGPL